MMVSLILLMLSSIDMASIVNGLHRLRSTAFVNTHYNNNMHSSHQLKFVNTYQNNNMHPSHNINNIHSPHQSRLHMITKKEETIEEIEADSARLRVEIKELREEAKQRLLELEKQLNALSTTSTSTTISSSNKEDELLPAPAVTFSNNTPTKKKKSKGIANLLDQTTWKISLSIGREPNTWMPKEWGANGNRINISFNAEFSPSQLYDRDDFFRGGYTNAKILNIIDNEITMGPSVNEGTRSYKVRDGGWQVTQGDGPMRTDLLRFYIEVDEQIQRGDVSIPKGRVYCSCGYFPYIMKGESSVKELYMSELKQIDEQMGELQQKKDNSGFLDGIKISRDMFQLSRKAEEVSEKMFNMSVTEPDKKLLKFSKDGDVGLTKEGGVCCRVMKGPVTEYHILGRFSSACIDND